MEKLIKKTHKKLVISGDFIELYTFEKPLFYNHEPHNTLNEKNNQNERSFQSIKRSRDNIRRLCNANINKQHKPKFLTLTFKEEITDLKEARKYFSTFIKKYRYKHGDLQYLGVAEIQKKRYQKYGKKVWHFHIIFFNLPFIYGIKEDITQSWPYGFIKINALDHVKNAGAYVSKYLRKDLYEKELIGQKSYFASKNLKKPFLHRDQQNVDNYLQTHKTEVQYENEYESCTHGVIKYKVLKHANNTSN
jgi:hypothetical protein